ncbi:MAG: putative glycoside hydrolase, partial [Proteobacteria bacterium]|nr:putative glycoside hydrolase [Pseudomonadota bacterium]
VKGLYLAPNSVQEKLDHYIELANKTELNAYVIDIKSDYGLVQYKSKIPQVLAANAYTPVYDPKVLIKKMHDNGIYVIGKMTCFLDRTYPKHNNDLAIKKANGDLMVYGHDLHFLDPTKKGSWEYLLKIAQEAVELGFDEIQFDYIRFPETSVYDYVLDDDAKGKERREFIEGFIKFARENLPEGTVLSADIFGMPLISKKDWGEIGQSLESVGWDLDFISPMVYPSHWANSAPKGKRMANGRGQSINGIHFTHPDLHPYEVVYNALVAGKRRIEAVEGYDIKVRPYIQGFTDSGLEDGYYQYYGVEQYRQQIKAVYDAGYDGWIFWHARNNYVEEAFLPE